MIAPVRWGRALCFASFGNDRSSSLVDYQKSTASVRIISLATLKMTPLKTPKRPDSFAQNSNSSATIYLICVDASVDELG